MTSTPINKNLIKTNSPINKNLIKTNSPINKNLIKTNSPINKNLITRSNYYIPYFISEKEWDKIQLNIKWFKILFYNYKIYI